MTRKRESLLPSLRLSGSPEIRRFRDDMNKLFEGFVDDFFVNDKWISRSIFNDLQPKVSFPKINVSETAENYIVDIAVAGFSKDDVELELKDNVLTVSAEKKEDSNDVGKDCYICREISYRSFKRPITFPLAIDTDTADASYKDGIITVIVNKIIEKDEEKSGVKVEVK